jgi:hypothetical protein
MSITKHDLRDFSRFANERLKNGAANSLVDLAGEWEAQHRETRQTVAETGHLPIEIDDATLKQLAEAFSEVSDEILLQRVRARRTGVTTEQLLSKAASAAAKAAQE